MIDGSMMNPRWKGLSTLGFAIVVISDAGDLVAWGNGVPPEWCDSASAAEAWALCQVLRSATPFVPRVLTDCLGLLQTVDKGASAACSANMRLARTWHHIAQFLNNDLSLLCRQGSLTWMPAHQPESSIGRACKSNGRTLTALEWRANRLVDTLAKAAANKGAPPRSHVQLLVSAEALVKHKLGQLGAATHAANNFEEETLLDSGVTVKKTRRDAQLPPTKAKPRRLKQLKVPEAKKAAVDATTCEQAGDDAERDSSQDEQSAVYRPRRRTATKRSGLATKAFTRELIRNNPGTRTTPSQPDPTAVAKLVAAASAEDSNSRAPQEADLDTGASVYKWLWKEEEQLEEPPPTAATGRCATATTATPSQRSSRATTNSEARKATGSCRPARSTGAYTKESTASAVASLLGNAYQRHAGVQQQQLSK